MKFSDKKVILFDLDGTLVDSAPDLVLALNHMLETLEREPFCTETIRTWVGNGAQTLVKRGLSGSSVVDEAIDPELVSQALNIFLGFYAQNLCVETVTYPNVPATLKTLKAKGYRLVIVTNKPYAFIDPLLEGLGLTDLFEFCIGGDSLSRHKPDPLPLLHVCERLGVTASECVMVGDSRNDIVAANAADMHSIGVSYGYNYGEKIDLYAPNRVVDDFSEIVALLG
ncbi:phosphoglycolate phosphatase [bacterium]|nr:phosphoglycolate phosphatase [bacterium]